VNQSSKSVFLSYASQDAEAAQNLCNALRAVGIEVWFDRGELRGGDAWDASIRRQIKSCALFIPVISRNTHARDEGYFRLEWKLAVDRSHLMTANRPFLVPVVIDDTSDQDEQVPDRFRDVQWTRLAGGRNAAEFVERVRRLLSPDGATPAGTSIGVSVPPTASTGARSARSTPPASRSFAPWIVGSLVILAAGYFLADRFLASKHATLVKEPVTATVDAAPALAVVPRKSIAVLPFVNMSGDPAQEYFSDGLSEELLDALSRLEPLQVVARTSSFSFKGQNVDTATIARKLHVDSIIEGSVRRAGNTVRITVQLIDATSGFHVWSQTFDRNLSNILQVQTEIATAIAQRLKIRFAGDEAARPEAGGTTNPDAYDAYLRGVQLTHSGTNGKQQWHDALAYFDRAISLDPSYASAHAGRASALATQAIFFATPGARVPLHKQAVAAAERAVALAPNSGEAHSTLAAIRSFMLLDFRGAAPEFDRALALAPGSARVQQHYGGFNSLLGHRDVGIAASRRAVGLDPQNFVAHLNLGQALRFARRYDEAIAAFHAALALVPESHDVENNLIETLLDAGEYERARSICASPASPLDEDDRSSCLAQAFFALGRRADAQRELERFQALDGDGSAYGYACIYARAGDTAAALRWLSRAEELLDSGLSSLRVLRCFDAIRKEPQFKAIETRMNLPP
jgi:TolB-like protein/Tfp pilus assembly protein PilF